MRQRWLFLVALTLVVPAAALAASVTIDYDHTIELGTYRTFSYVESDESLQGANPLMADRVKAGVIKMAKDAGLEMVDEDPDLHITYHVSSKEGLNMTTTGMGYGYGWGWGGGVNTSSTMVTTYTEGTIIVDAVEVEKNELIWRGTATQVMKAKPEKQQKQLEKALAKMLSKWEQIKTKTAKQQPATP